MKATAPRPPGRPRASASRLDEEGFKDLYFPTGEALQFLHLEMAFQEAGYQIQMTELSPHRPPVAVLHLVRRKAPRFSDAAQFAEHVRQVLESAEIHVPRADLTSEQTGNRVLVAFLWQPPAPGSVEGMQLDELLAILP